MRTFIDPEAKDLMSRIIVETPSQADRE